MRFHFHPHSTAAATMLCTLLLAANAQAQDTMQRRAHAGRAASEAPRHAGQRAMKAAAQRHAIRFAAQDEADTLITTQPEGKVYDNMVVSQNAIAYNSAIGYYDATTDCSFGTVVEGNDGCIYIKDIAPDACTGTWVKAERLDGDTILIRRQRIGEYNYSDGTTGVLYVCKMAADKENGYWASVDGDTDIKLIWKDGQLTTPEEMNAEEPACVVGVEEYSAAEDMLYFNDAYWNVHYYPQTDTYATLPEGAEPIDMKLSYCAQDGTGYKTHASAYFDGDEVYLQTDDRCPGWFRGHIEGDKVTFQNAQYLGKHSLYDAHEYFITAKKTTTTGEDGTKTTTTQIVDRLTLDYDAATRTMTAPEGIFFTNGGKQKINAAQRFEKPQFYILQDKAYTPANPEITGFWDYDDTYKSAELDFTINTTSVDGEDLDTYYLYYNIYVDDSVFEFTPGDYKTFDTVTTDIPYGFEDNEGWILSTIVRIFFQPSKNMGIQAVYKGGGEVRKSDIVLYDVNTRTVSTRPATAIGTVKGTQEATPVACYRLDGRRTGKPSRGISIVRMSDGSTRKVMAE